MRKLIIALLALLAAAPAALAQERRTYSQGELDQMLAPIALYPDALLSQVLMASTYPLDIVEAARWTRAHPGLQGDEAVAAVAGEDWDPSVKSLVAFPNQLLRMDENLAWTRSLGEAFLEQEPHVMETVQQLRRRADAAGHLLPDERLRVVADGDSIAIEPADPQVVYVPCYDPWVVYGPWSWSAYPPVAWAPCPGYYAYRPGFWWGVGIGVSTNFFFGGVDWHQRHVKVVHVNNFFVRPRAFRQRPLHVGKWQHVPLQHREFQRRRFDGDRRVQHVRPMPPALSASPTRPVVSPTRPVVSPTRPVVSPLPGPVVKPLGARPRQVERPQPRMAAPRAVQPRMRVQQPQRRMESRPQMRGEARGEGRGGGWRGGGNGGGRGGGWR